MKKMKKSKRIMLTLVITIVSASIFTVLTISNQIELAVPNKLNNFLPNNRGTIAFIEDFDTISYKDIGTTVDGWGKGTIYNSKISPPKLASLNLLPQEIDVKIYGNYAFVLTTNALRSVDISDPTNPIEIGVYSPITWAEEFDISSNHAYIPQEDSNEIIVIDISDPTNLVKVGSTLIENAFEIEDIFISGNFLYTHIRREFLGVDGIEVFDITDPIHPVRVAFHQCPISGYNWTTDIHVSGDYLYIVFDGGEIYIFDISDPTNPLLTGIYPRRGYSMSEAIFVSGAYAFLSYYRTKPRGVGIMVLDITDPSNPTLLTEIKTSGWMQEIVVIGDYLYGCQSGPQWTLPFGLQIINIADIYNPHDAGSNLLRVENPNQYYYTRRLEISGNYAYTIEKNGPNGLQVYDISMKDLFESPCIANSKKINEEGHVSSAMISAIDSIPSNTNIQYHLSADGGTNWEDVSLGESRIFLYPGFDLRWRASLSTNDPKITPSIDQISINYELDRPPTMDVILEPERQNYSSAPIFSHLGFNDDVALDDGWYQIDSYSEDWTSLFIDCGDVEWNYDGWVMPDFKSFSGGLHTIYFKVSDEVGNIKGENGEWSWEFYKELPIDSTPPVIAIEYQDGDGTDGNPGKWNVYAYDDESGINEDTVNILIDGEFAGDALGDYDVPNTLGDHAISVEVENNDGYLGSDSDSITITDDDTSNPVINYMYTGDGTDGNPGEIIVTASDESGLSVDPSGTYTVPNSLGTHVFEFTAIDNDNDRVDDALTEKVIIEITIYDDDITPPIIDIQYIGSGFDEDPGYFEWNIFDIDSGINHVNITVIYESTEGLDDYIIYPEGSEIGSWNLPPNLGIYTIRIFARDNDDDRTLFVDSLTTELTRDQEILDDDVDPPELSNLVIIPDIFEINVTFDATDESGIGDISTFINGELIEPLTRVQHGNTYSLIFENQWLFEIGTSEVVIQVEDGDDDRPNDTLISLIIGTFENILYQMYEHVDWQIEELKNYIDEYLCPRNARFLNRKLTRAQDHLNEAFSHIEDGKIICGLFHDAIAKVMVQITEFKVELLNRLDRIDDEQAEYIIDSIHTIRNNIVLLIGASTGEEQAHEIALIEVELLNLKDFIEDEIPCCVGRCLRAKISCSAKLLELALFKISMGYSIDCILEYTQCKLEHAISKINFLLEGGKIPEDVANYLIEKISNIIGDIEQLKNN